MDARQVRTSRLPLQAFRGLSFGEKLGAGVGATLVIAGLVTVVSVYALRSVTHGNNQQAHNLQSDLLAAEKLRTLAHQKVAISRGFLLTRDRLFIEDAAVADAQFKTIFLGLSSHADSEQERSILKKLSLSEVAHQDALNRAIKLRKGRAGVRRVSRVFNQEIMPRFDELERALNSYVSYKSEKVESAYREARAAAVRATRLILVIAAAALGLAFLLAFVLARVLHQHYQRVSTALSDRDKLLAVVSHDLKNPLTAILMSIPTLLKLSRSSQAGQTASDNDSFSRMARTVQRSSEHMKRLTQDLLDITRMETAGLALESSRHSVRTLLRESCELLEPIAQQKGVVLRQEVPVEDRQIACDRERVMQVFSNLLGNAIKFTPAQGSVDVSVDYLEDGARFCVRDSGPGISEEELPHLFDRFWQARRNDSRGLGLGLTIAKGIVEAHGGKIDVTSVKGQGSRFFFTLPYSKASKGSAGLTRATTAQAESQGADFSRK
jgi:signal transduction histidine kinase